MQNRSSRLLKKYSIKNGYLAIVISESDLDQAVVE